MKILATFDGSAFSESILPQLEVLSALPDVSFILVRVGAVPHGQAFTQPQVPLPAGTPASGAPPVVVDSAEPRFAETKDQAVDRTVVELREYLDALSHRLRSLAPCSVLPVLDDHPASAIVKLAMAEQPDMIVMATHGHTGAVHVLFGDTAEKVVAAAVAPVLLVHPGGVIRSRPTGRESRPVD
jgi:nucleotide-binding universal stress UspA family protein